MRAAGQQLVAPSEDYAVLGLPITMEVAATSMRQATNAGPIRSVPIEKALFPILVWALAARQQTDSLGA